MAVQTVLPTASSYLRNILDRERASGAEGLTLQRLLPRVERIALDWAGRHLVGIEQTGGSARGAINASGPAQLDLLLSIDAAADFTPRQIYESLYFSLERLGLRPRTRLVSIVVWLEGIAIDLIPARRDNRHTGEHWLYSHLQGGSLLTDPARHVLDGRKAGQHEEVRVLKLWRDRNGLVLPGLYLELAIQAALRDRHGDLAENVWAVLGYLETHFVARSVLDPANALNVVSEEIDFREKARIRTAAKLARAARSWHDILV
jgi:hypothetical protein